MKQSSLSKIHVALIMDGNGRWATMRGQPRVMGHRAGARTARAVIQEAAALGIGTLTIYAFSADNWARPPREVSALMSLLKGFLLSEAEVLAEAGIRLSLIGRRDRLNAPLREAMQRAEALTAGGSRLHLRVAVDYSAREAILAVAERLVGETSSIERFAQLLGGGSPDVDLLVRTGGEQRLSDFLLWECAYAELLFSPRMWPDFGPDELRQAVASFRGRDRRFGALPLMPVRDCIP